LIVNSWGKPAIAAILYLHTEKYSDGACLTKLLRPLKLNNT